MRVRPKSLRRHRRISHSASSASGVELGIQKLDSFVGSAVNFVALLVFGYLRSYVLFRGASGLHRFERYVAEKKLAPARLMVLASTMLFSVGMTIFNDAEPFTLNPWAARDTAEHILAGDAASIGWQVIPVFICSWVVCKIGAWCLARVTFFTLGGIAISRVRDVVVELRLHSQLV